MAPLCTTGAGMDDLDNPLMRDIDNHMDDAELLPFRYQRVLDKS